MKLKAYKSEEDENIILIDYDIYTIPLDLGTILTYCNYEYSPFYIRGIEAEIMWRAIKMCRTNDTISQMIEKINEVEL
jgi:hypothetical protein